MHCVHVLLRIFHFLQAKNKNAKTEKDKAIREATSQMEKKEQQRINEDKKRISALERKIKELETTKPVVLY